ncbi:MAG: winged helix-turn-helix domain-containing protein [Solirubrobacterales bacterium]
MTALRHPLRRQLLKLMLEREEMSPAEASHELDEALSNVSYHMTQLAKMDVVHLKGTDQVRGAVVHFYVPNPEVAKLPWVREVIGLGD